MKQELRDFVQKVLHRFGYTVLTAGDGEEALHVSGAHAGPIHLLLTDVVMPHMNGRDLADAIVRTRPNLRVVYMSGHSDEVVSSRGLLERPPHLIQKPFSAESLAREIRRALDAPLPGAGRDA